MLNSVSGSGSKSNHDVCVKLNDSALLATPLSLVFYTRVILTTTLNNLTMNLITIDRKLENKLLWL